MNERPTPETDAFFRTFADGEAAPSHAEYFDRMRRLECERDEAREWQTMLSGWGGTPEIVHDFIKGQQMRIYARAYGLDRDELRYILDPADVKGPDYPSETFRVLKEKEIRQHGEYRTRRLVLQAWDRMEAEGEFAVLGL